MEQVDKVKFCCSICLGRLRDPVTIACGHSYCMGCVTSYWDEEDERKLYRCPQCREIFAPRPVLAKNILLAELMEELEMTGPEDVGCDVCIGRKLKASKSCLVCQASYCEQHLQPHYQCPTFRKHELVEPSVELQDGVCPRHNEVMKIFCRTDQQCICILCSMDEHKSHKTVTAATERAEKQKEVGGSRQRIQQRIQDREKDVKELQQVVEAINLSADKTAEVAEKVFAELIRLMRERHRGVEQKVRSRRETEVSRVRELQEELEQEIGELKRKDAELERLSLTEDHAKFLRQYPSLSRPTEPTTPRTPRVENVMRYFEDIAATAMAAGRRTKRVFAEKPAEPNITVEILQYLRPL